MARGCPRRRRPCCGSGRCGDARQAALVANLVRTMQPLKSAQACDVRNKRISSSSRSGRRLRAAHHHFPPLPKSPEVHSEHLQAAPPAPPIQEPPLRSYKGLLAQHAPLTDASGNRSPGYCTSAGPWVTQIGELGLRFCSLMDARLHHNAICWRSGGKGARESTRMRARTGRSCPWQRAGPNHRCWCPQHTAARP